MSKTGVNFSFDVTKLDKSKFYKGKNGAIYANLTVFIDSDKDQYDNNGGIQQSLSKEERDQGVKAPYIGNAKIFWSDSGQSAPKQAEPAATLDEEDLPF